MTDEMRCPHCGMRIQHKEGPKESAIKYAVLGLQPIALWLRAIAIEKAIEEACKARDKLPKEEG